MYLYNEKNKSDHIFFPYYKDDNDVILIEEEVLILVIDFVSLI